MNLLVFLSPNESRQFSIFAVFCRLKVVRSRCLFDCSTNTAPDNKKLYFCSLSGDVPRVDGQLAVSRAFGDKSLKSHLRSDPDIQFEDTSAGAEVLILASDGLWKVCFFKLHAAINQFIFVMKSFQREKIVSYSCQLYFRS